MYLDNPHTIEIEARGLMIRMNNTVHPSLLEDPGMDAEGAIMLADISNVDAIYIVCGRTDMRNPDGRCAIIQDQFPWRSTMHSIFCCGRKCDRIKAILKEPDGIVMIWQTADSPGSYRWPRDVRSPEPHMEGNSTG